MHRVAVKPKALKPFRRAFSRENYSGIEKRVREAHQALLLAQRDTLAAPTTLNAEREIDAQSKWRTLNEAEEAYFRQKSHISWLREGDSNSTYFHRYAASRKAINHIHAITNEHGTRVETQSGIMDHCLSYFKELLGNEVGAPMITQSDMNALLPFRCSEIEKAYVSKQVSRTEIKEAFLSLPRNKTPGPDGYTAEFFIHCWDVVGPEITEAISDFFSSGTLLKQWNATNLVLIPKTANASSTVDFRPISCLNTVYKVIAIILASRLKSILEKVISGTQSAFIPGRLLSENVLLATELVQGYNRKNITPRGMLKVDLRKAFDSVRWDFILAALKAIDLPDIFVLWLKECITTPTFSVCVKEASGGFFKSAKGLRQGDPMSPYLFVLAMEFFSRLLQSRYDMDQIQYHPRTT